MLKSTDADAPRKQDLESPFLDREVLETTLPDSALDTRLKELTEGSPFTKVSSHPSRSQSFPPVTVSQSLSEAYGDGSARAYAPVSFEGEVPPPRGVPPFEHFFQPYKPDHSGLAWIPDRDEQKLTALNPGFIDDKDSLENSPLQDALTNLLTENADFSRHLSSSSVRLGKAGPDDKIRVALIDLTEKRLTNPQFAGWGSTVAVDCGSAAKVAVLYAAFQLKADLEHIAKTEGLHKTPDLVQLVTKRWRTVGIAEPPKVEEIFNGDQDPPVLAFADDFENAINNIVFHAANVASSLMIKKLGFPYIASVLWHSGLRHPRRGGLWLYWNFDDKAPQEWSPPALPAPGPVFPHTATALSLATFYALLAQGRLPNPGATSEMQRILKETWYSSVLPSAVITAKVGLLYNLSKCLNWETKDGKRRCTTYEVSAAHEGDLIENGKLRYAAAIMTVGLPDGEGVLRKLIVQLDDLIRKNNP